jgi:transposase-like protein
MRQAFLQADAKTASVGRLNKRVKRRADVIGIFQNEASITPHKRRPCFSAKM